MAKFCSNCGKEVNENADICLNCGVLVNKVNSKTNVNNVSNKKKGLPVWAIVLIIGGIVLIPLIVFAILGILFFNFVNSDVPECVDKVCDDIYDYYEEYNIVDEGTIGDTLEIDGIYFTLNNALRYSSIGDIVPEDGKEYLVFFFDVENTSGEERLITYLNFNGLIDDEKIMTTFIFSDIDGVSNLNKELESGETTSGYVAFEVDKTWENFDLNYRKLLGNKGITFYVTNESNDNYEL